LLLSIFFAIFEAGALRFTSQFRLKSVMKEAEFIRDILPLRDRMFRYAQTLLLSAEEAEDVVHDLLERMWRERIRIGPCRHASSFAMTAVRNGCYDRLRSRQAVRRRDDAVAAHAERTTTGAADGWEARDLVRRAMASLPERQREVLHLKDIEGYPTCEVAALMDCDEAQVRTILSRARRGLRTIIVQMTDDEKRTRRD